jgi:hypothetical protein
MTTTPDFRDFRALCAEMLEVMEYEYAGTNVCYEMRQRARTALATPPPEPPKTKPNLTPILASILLGRHEPLEWHHAAFLSAYFGYPSKDELRNIALTGVYSTPPPEPPTDEEIKGWAATTLGASQGNPGPFGWGWRCFSEELFACTIRAALKRWGKDPTTIKPQIIAKPQFPLPQKIREGIWFDD